MIDGIKATVMDRSKFEQNILNDKIAPLAGGKTDFFTGLFTEYPKGGSINCMEYKITQKEAFINGSLHKFYNNIFIGQNHNYNDFSYSNLTRSVNLLKLMFRLENCTKLTNVEFGFNIEWEEDPNNFITNRLLLFNFRDQDGRGKFDTGELSKEFKRTDYKWKIYKKRNDLNPSENILRVEIKFLLSRQLTKLGIFSIENLVDKKVLQNLFEFFLDRFDQLMILDDLSPSNLTREQKISLMEITNITYWNGLKEQGVTGKIQENRKANALNIISKLKLDTTKKRLRNLIVSKFSQMLNT